MTEKGFELRVNPQGQYDIVDWIESKEKNAICIYNDLGNYYYSSAKALCKRLNELAEENEQSKMMIATLRNMVLDQEDLEKEIKELKIKNDLLSDELKQAKAVINKKWSEYSKKKELSE